MHPPEVLRFYDTASFIDSIFISIGEYVFFLYEYTFLLSSYEVAEVIIFYYYFNN